MISGDDGKNGQGKGRGHHSQGKRYPLTDLCHTVIHGDSRWIEGVFQEGLGPDETTCAIIKDIPSEGKGINKGELARIE
ncbi:hypothetical protein JCM14469_17880 [Desulfatiferula olefinivorans]